MSNHEWHAMNTSKIVRQRGRPPAFDHDEALNKAMHVFWSHGYEGSSMAALTAAMGINKPSLYGAFGGKEELFRKVVQRYLAGPVAYISEAVSEPTAYRVVEKLLTMSAEFLTRDQNPRGCMVIQGALTCGEGAELIQQELRARRSAYEENLRQRFERACAEGDLPADERPAELAKYVATIHQGMSVQATSGASKGELLEVVGRVLKHWPVVERGGAGASQPQVLESSA
jgi:AcrR family transcriptional regulator